MVAYTVSPDAYLKLFFHAAKYPHKEINGVLVGKLVGDVVEILDAIPLLHHWTSLSPMMEIGLDLVRTSVNLKFAFWSNLLILTMFVRRGSMQNLKD
jgi:hypothetical protein